MVLSKALDNRKKRRGCVKRPDKENDIAPLNIKKTASHLVFVWARLCGDVDGRGHGGEGVVGGRLGKLLTEGRPEGNEQPVHDAEAGHGTGAGVEKGKIRTRRTRAKGGKRLEKGGSWGTVTKEDM